MSATVTMEEAVAEMLATAGRDSARIVGDLCHVTLYRLPGESQDEWFARVGETREAMQAAEDKARRLFPNLYPKAEGVEELTDADYGSEDPFEDGEDSDEEEECE